jgi:long-chain fatty acid transport protein
MSKRFFSILGVFVFAITLGTPAFSAGLGDTYEFGVRAMSFGGAFTAIADNYSAAYYNPAGLGQIKTHQTSIEFLYTRPTFKVEKLSGEDLIIYDNAGEVRNNPTKPSAGHGMDLKFPIVGMAINFNDISDLPVNATLGLAASIPQNLNSTYMLANMQPDQPHFIRYGDNIDRLHLSTGIGVELLPSLVYAGAGVQSMLYGGGKIYIDGLDLMSDEPRVNGQVGMQAWLHHKMEYGVLVTPMAGMVKIGACWRDKQEVAVDPLVANASVETFGLPITDIQMIMAIHCFFVPEELSVGAAANVGPMTISVQRDKQKWSDYTFSPNDEVYYGGNADFKDTVNLRAGVEFKPNENTSLMFGFAKIPTPVPNQSYRETNFLDMDKKVFSGGFSQTMNLPTVKNPAKIAGVYQYQKCDDYTVYKDGETYANGEDQETYTVEGDAFAAGLSVTLSF